MQIHTTVEAFRRAQLTMGPVAFVPTMGNLHEGHIHLMREAAQHAPTVVASIFVNRLQFGAGEDFDRYPRTFEEDCAKLEAAGVSHLFAPDEGQMYPEGPEGYRVVPPLALTNVLEGAVRPGHFEGVATVVLKLLNVVRPEVMLLGKKDWQQLAVLSAMVAHLALPVRIVPGQTVRANDGLALSSRNGYLDEPQRREAPRLYETLLHVANEIRAGNHDFSGLETWGMDRLSLHGWQPDYITVRRQVDLTPPAPQETQRLIVLGAAKLGTVRLIDNLEID
jgi:pantoate--beta-alanine ligase